MAAVDDIYNQITRNSRTRRGRSFFPAANGSAQGQVINPSTSTTGFRALPPDQNPSYQPRPPIGRDQLQTFQIPGSGSVTMPQGSRIPSAYQPQVTNFSGVGNAINALASTNPATSAIRDIGQGFSQIYKSFMGNQNPSPSSTPAQGYGTNNPTDLLYGNGKTNPLFGATLGSGASSPSTIASVLAQRGQVNQLGQTTVNLPSGGSVTVGRPVRTELGRYFD